MLQEDRRGESIQGEEGPSRCRLGGLLGRRGGGRGTGLKIGKLGIAG